MDREIHFYTYDPQLLSYLDSDPYVHNCVVSWDGTKEEIEQGFSNIWTTQMGLLSTRLFELGYRIFIHESPQKQYEIKLGDKNERTNREIRMGYNLFKMWQAGEFDK